MKSLENGEYYSGSSSSSTSGRNNENSNRHHVQSLSELLGRIDWEDTSAAAVQSDQHHHSSEQQEGLWRRRRWVQLYHRQQQHRGLRFEIILFLVLLSIQIIILTGFLYPLITDRFGKS